MSVGTASPKDIARWAMSCGMAGIGWDTVRRFAVTVRLAGPDAVLELGESVLEGPDAARSVAAGVLAGACATTDPEGALRAVSALLRQVSFSAPEPERVG